MEDEKLSAQAAELVKSAAELTKSDRKRLPDESIDAAIQVVRALAKAPAAEDVRTDLRAVERRLEAMRGLTMGRAIQLLMAEPPDGKPVRRPRSGRR